MNIMIIDQYAGSPIMGMEYRPYDMAKQWQKQGHRVVIIGATYSHLRRRQPKAGKSEIEGVPYLFIPTPQYQKNGVRRAMNIGCFALQLVMRAQQLAQQYKPQVVVASSTHPLDSFGAKKIAQYCGALLVYEVHDLWPLSLEELHGFSPRSPVVKMIKEAQRYLVKRADCVVSVIEQADIYLTQELGIVPKRYAHIPNGIDAKAFWSNKAFQAEREWTELPRYCRAIWRCKKANQAAVVYLGGFAKANYLGPLVQAAKELGGKAEVFLVGDGMEKENLQRLAKKEQIENVHFFSAAPKVAVPGILSRADFLYLGTAPRNLYRYGVAMNKLFDYMLAAKPIVFSSVCSKSPIQQAGCGVMTAACPKAIAEGVQYLLHLTPEQRQAMGERGRQYCLSHHDYEVLSQEFLRVLTDLPKAVPKEVEKKRGISRCGTIHCRSR